MATKKRAVYQCAACEHQEPKWMGRCPSCGNWNTFDEVVVSDLPGASKARAGGSRGAAGPAVESVPLASVETRESPRIDSGVAEINRVLGGGIMRGSLTLIGGEPGIGKSTLMLQVAAQVRIGGPVLYVSGEESPTQIRMRAERLGLLDRAERIEILSSADLSSVLRVLDRLRPMVVIVDSIQTLHSPEVSSNPGTVNQIKMCAMEIGEWVKARDAALFLVGHVTKEGAIAGPKVVEHMVDAVLYFDEADNDVRFLRATKNRFGSVDEIAIFTMTEHGLSEVNDPRVLFLTHRGQDLPPGVAIAPVYEGSRVLLVEIQSLVVPAKGGMPRVYSDRIDSSRVSRIAAVLEKHVGLSFSDRDIYVNVAGGMRITEVAVELPLAVALYSARTGLAVPSRMGITGEVSLAGEIREVSRMEKRVKAMLDTGYECVIGPSRGAGALPPDAVRGVAAIRDVAAAVFGAETARARD